MNFRKVNIEVNTLTEKASLLDKGYYLESANGNVYFKEDGEIKCAISLSSINSKTITLISLSAFNNKNFNIFEKSDWWDDLPRLCRDKNGGTYLIDKNSDNLHVETDRGHFLCKSVLTPLTNEEIKQFIKD